MTDNKLALRQPGALVRTMDDAVQAAQAMAKSGYFQDAREASQALVKIMAGAELGFGPFASMTGVYIIQNRPSIGANLMAAAVKSSGRYDYRVIEMTDAACEIAFFDRGSEIGKSRFTTEDARKAGTKNLDKFPRNMLFARAMSNGTRWYCPDVFAGAPMYTPEELGANVNEAGDVIDVPVAEAPAPQPAPAPAKQPTQAEQPATEQPAQADYSSDTRACTPLTLMAAGVVKNFDHGKALMGKLALAGMSMSDAMKRVNLYSGWKAAGAEKDDAARNAIENIPVP